MTHSPQSQPLEELSAFAHLSCEESLSHDPASASLILRVPHPSRLLQRMRSYDPAEHFNRSISRKIRSVAASHHSLIHYGRPHNPE
jgi:hypothetical protein